MLTFIDGPAEGKTLQTQRNPVMLRVVVDPKGGVDCLDALDDVCRTDERVFCYIGCTEGAHGMMTVSGKHGRRRCVAYVARHYRLYVSPPCDEIMRDNDDWQHWCNANLDYLMEAHVRECERFARSKKQ